MDRSRKKPSHIDQLFEDFLRELDVFSHNGVLRHMEFPRVWEVADHYIELCSVARDREELTARIRLFVDSRVKYSTIESDVVLSLRTEKTVSDRIRLLMKEKWNQTSKLAGVAIQFGILKPLKLIRAVVEPAFVNTAVTFSLTMNPAFVQPAGGTADAAPRSERTRTVTAESKKTSLKELSVSRVYDQAQISHLMDQRATDRSEIVTIRVASGKADVSLQESGVKSYRNVSVEVDRRIVKTEVITVSRAVISREPVHIATQGLRDVGDIQRHMAQHGDRIMNYARGRMGKTAPSRRVPVRFSITPSGAVREVHFLSSVPSTAAARIRAQMLQLRFSEIDARFGDQTVYHSFFF